MANRVILAGRLGLDAKVSTIANGAQMIVLSVATGVKWKDKVTNEDRGRTDWHRVVIFNDNVAKLATSMTKGRMVHIEAELRYRMYVNPSTQKEAWITEVVLDKGGRFEFLDARPKTAPAGDVSDGDEPPDWLSDQLPGEYHPTESEHA